MEKIKSTGPNLRLTNDLIFKAVYGREDPACKKALTALLRNLYYHADLLTEGLEKGQQYDKIKKPFRSALWMEFYFISADRGMSQHISIQRAVPRLRAVRSI